MPRRSFAVIAAGLTLSLSLLGGTGSAEARASGPAARAAAAASGGDFCTTDEGVTVVVDLSDLGGAIVVRCVDEALDSSYTGWDALADAGFSPQSPSRTPGFVCRLAGEPAASRTFDIPENPDYHEQCVNTPPTSAYWGYWYSDNGGSWTYSSTGAASRRVIEGGFEGWRFSLNSAGDPPAPGIAPKHSVEPSTPTTPPTHQPGGGHTQSSDGPTRPSETTPPGEPTSSAGEKPADVTAGPVRGNGDDRPTGGPTPTTTTSTSGVEVTSEVPEAAADAAGGGSAGATFIGVGVLAVLGAGAGVAAWRRRRA